jgi:hypothetical protein
MWMHVQIWIRRNRVSVSLIKVTAFCTVSVLICTHDKDCAAFRKMNWICLKNLFSCRYLKIFRKYI